VTVAFTKVVYRAMVGNDTPTEYPQDPAQACMGIGDAIVAGFRAEREVRPGQGHSLTVVSLYGQNDVLFGQYEFTGRV
jgi:hypothetical protein